MKFLQFILFTAFFHFSGFGQQPFIKGVYGNPATLLKAGYRFDSLGMNAVFVRSISLNADFFSTAKKQGCRVFVEFPTLNGKDYLKDHPEAWPINEKGLKADPADWFMGICATNAAFREFRARQLRDILDQFAVDGIFLDYVHWHAQFESDRPILPETCFCDRCTGLFSGYIGKNIPGETVADRASWILRHADVQWRAWRISILNGWVTDMKNILRAKRPQALLGIYYAAWYPGDHDSALGRILGIDVAGLAERADVLAPMLFHGMLARPPVWVGQYIEWLGGIIKQKPKQPLVWPIVQAHNKPGIITPEEFRTVMQEGSKSPSSGIMMFADGSLLEDPEKLRVMKALYRKQ
ncbi:MAG TPA: hypothetical protein VFX73_06795 [Chitinophagaceae bacterium]|nr:hypothetical protein [Chitinophagaceae bacterium]